MNKNEITYEPVASNIAPVYNIILVNLIKFMSSSITCNWRTLIKIRLLLKDHSSKINFLKFTYQQPSLHLERLITYQKHLTGFQDLTNQLIVKRSMKHTHLKLILLNQFSFKNIFPKLISLPLVNPNVIEYIIKRGKVFKNGSIIVAIPHNVITLEYR